MDGESGDETNRDLPSRLHLTMNTIFHLFDRERRYFQPYIIRVWVKISVKTKNFGAFEFL